MPYLAKAGHQAVEHADQRAGGALELDHLAGEFVDAAGDFGVAAEDLGLDLVDVVLDSGHHRGVAVDHRVEDGVEGGLGAQGEQFRGGLHAAADRGQVGGRAVADRDEEVLADEDVELAEFHLLRRVQVTGGAQDDEEGVAVTFQLGALMGLQGVLDGQRVEVELGGQGVEFGLGRAVQADPGHAVGLFAQLPEGVGQGGGGGHAAAVAVDRGVDHAAVVRRRRRGGPRSARARRGAAVWALRHRSQLPR